MQASDKAGLSELVKVTLRLDDLSPVSLKSKIQAFSDKKKAQKTYKVSEIADQHAERIAQLVKESFQVDATLANRGKYVAAMLKGAGVEVDPNTELNQSQMRDYAGLLSGLVVATDGGNVDFLKGHVSDCVLQKLRQIATKKEKHGGANEIEVRVKVDPSIFGTFQEDYDNHVLYKKAVRVEMLRKVIDILLQTTIKPNQLSYDQCTFLINMFDILRNIVNYAKGVFREVNDDQLLSGEVIKLKTIIESGRKQGFLQEDAVDRIITEVDTSEQKSTYDHIPEQDRQWVQSMVRDLDIRKEVFEEVIRKITIVVNMVTLRFISREMVQHDKKFYEKYKERIHATNAYLYALMTEEFKKIQGQIVSKNLNDFMTLKLQRCVSFANCMREIDLLIQLCSQREISGIERLRTPEVGGESKMRSIQTFFDEIKKLNAPIILDNKPDAVERLLEKTVTPHRNYMSRLREIFEIFLDITQQILDKETLAEHKILLGNKVSAKELAEMFDSFMVESTVAYVKDTQKGDQQDVVQVISFDQKFEDAEPGTKYIHQLYQDTLSAVFNFVLLHTGKFREVVYHQSNTPASIAKKIYLGGSIEDAKKITKQQMLDVVREDFDFVYDAVKYHQFVREMLTAAKINVTKLPYSAEPKDIVNTYITYTNFTNSTTSTTPTRYNVGESISLACLISQRFPGADKAKKIIEFIRLIQSEISMAGFSRELKSGDMFPIEGLNENPFVTEQSFPDNADHTRVKQIADAVMSKYSQYNQLVHNLSNQLIEKVSRIQYDDIQKLQNYKKSIQKLLSLQSQETMLDVFFDKVQQEPTSNNVGIGIITFLIEFYKSFDLTNFDVTGEKDIDFAEILKSFDTQSVVSEQAFQDNMKTILRGLIVLLQKGISQQDLKIRNIMTDIKADQIENIPVEKQNIIRRHLINSYIIQANHKNYATNLSNEIGDVFSIYSGRPIAPSIFFNQSFADIVLQRAVLMSYHTKPDYLKRNLDSLKQKIIDSLRNNSLRVVDDIFGRDQFSLKHNISEKCERMEGHYAFKNSVIKNQTNIQYAKINNFDIIKSVIHNNTPNLFFSKGWNYVQGLNKKTISKIFENCTQTLSKLLSVSNIEISGNPMELVMFADVFRGQPKDEIANLLINIPEIKNQNATTEHDVDVNDVIQKLIKPVGYDATEYRLTLKAYITNAPHHRVVFSQNDQGKKSHDIFIQTAARVLQLIYLHILNLQMTDRTYRGYVSPINFICNLNETQAEDALSRREKSVDDSFEFIKILSQIDVPQHTNLVSLITILAVNSIVRNNYEYKQGCTWVDNPSEIGIKDQQQIAILKYLRVGFTKMCAYIYGRYDHIQRNDLDQQILFALRALSEEPIIQSNQDGELPRDIGLFTFGKEGLLYAVKYAPEIVSCMKTAFDKLILFNAILPEDNQRSFALSYINHGLNSFKHHNEDPSIEGNIASDVALLPSFLLLCDGIVSAYQGTWTSLKKQFETQYASFSTTEYQLEYIKPDQEGAYRDYHTLNLDTVALLVLQDNLQLDPFYVDPRTAEFGQEGVKLQRPVRAMLPGSVQNRGFATTESFVNMPAERRNTLRLQSNIMIRMIDFVMPVFGDSLRLFYEFLKESYLQRLVTQTGQPVQFLSPEMQLGESERIKLESKNFFDEIICNKYSLARESALEIMYEKDEHRELFFQHLYSDPEKIHQTIPVFRNFIEKNLTNDTDREYIKEYIKYIAHTTILRQNIYLNQHSLFNIKAQWSSRHSQDCYTRPEDDTNTVSTIPAVIASNGIIPFSLDNFLEVVYFSLAKLSSSAGKLLLKNTTLPFRFYTLKDMITQYALRGHRNITKTEPKEPHTSDSTSFDLFVPSNDEFTTGCTLFKDEMGALGMFELQQAQEAKEGDIMSFFGLTILHRGEEITVSCIQESNIEGKTRKPVLYVTKSLDKNTNEIELGLYVGTDLSSFVKAGNFDGFIKISDDGKIYIGSAMISSVTGRDTISIASEIASRILGPSARQPVPTLSGNAITFQKIRENIVFSYVKEIQILEQQSNTETQSIQNLLFPNNAFAKKID